MPDAHKKRVAAWTLWLVFAVASGTGLRQYRVDNTLDEWLPQYAAPVDMGPFIVAGGRTADFDPDAVAAELARSDAVRFCVTPGAITARQLPFDIDPVGLVVSADRQWRGMIVFGTAAADEDAFIAAVRNGIAGTHGNDQSIALAGPPVFRETLNQHSQAMLPQISALMLVVGGITLWWTTRSAVAALSSVAAISLAQIVLVGLIAWCEMPMDMAVSMVPPMMMALGFSYAAHHAMRRDVTLTLVLAWLTTAAGIGTFAVTPVTPIQRFAVWGVLGLTLTLAAILTLVPGGCAKGTRTRTIGNMLSRAIAGGSTVRRRVVLLASVIASIAAVIAARGLHVEDDSLQYFPDDARIVRDYRLIDEHLGGTLPFIVTSSGRNDDGLAERIAQSPGVRHVIDLTPGDMRSDRRVVLGLSRSADLAALAPQIDAWQAWGRSHGESITWTGVAPQMLNIAHVLTRVAIVSFPLMLLISAGAVWAVGRRTSWAVASVWVNAMPVVALVLLIRVGGFALDLPALMIGAIAVGFAVDDTIHLTHAARSRGSVRHGLLDAWKPCAASSLAAAACFALFLLAPFRPTAQFGAFMAIAIAGAAVGDLLLLPAAIERGSADSR